MIYYQDNQFVNGLDIEFTTLVEAQANRSAVVDRVAASLRNQITAGTSPAEMSSWPIKLDEANAGGGLLLSLEAGYRRITKAALVQLVLTKAEQLATLEAQIAGVSGMHRDAIATLTSIEDVCAYDMRSDWPEV